MGQHSLSYFFGFLYDHLGGQTGERTGKHCRDDEDRQVVQYFRRARYKGRDRHLPDVVGDGAEYAAEPYLFGLYRSSHQKDHKIT